ncbi:MAG: hypothetical protein ABI551_09605 [Polyangiaceae bacterium]
MTTVFNLEIEDAHSYFVGEEGVWVHNGCEPGARFVGQPDGQLVDTQATPPGSYDQPGGGRTDILQQEDHGSGLSHTHDPTTNTNPSTGQTFPGREGPGRPATPEEIENITSGRATRSPAKGR